VLTIRELRCRGVDVRAADPVQTAAGTMASTPLALVDVLTDDGPGRAYARAYVPAALPALVTLIRSAGELLAGRTVAPADVTDRLRGAFALVGAEGLVAMAVSAVDMALWDAAARRDDVPLVELLGARSRPLPAYATLRTMAPEPAAREAAAAAAQGFHAIKVKLGAGAPEDDRAVIDAVRAATGDGVALMVDYNQTLSAATAAKRLEALDGLGLTWIEEPLAAADDAGHAALAERLATPVALGEHWCSEHDGERSLRARACDEAILDVGRIGGVTGWRRAADLAAAHRVGVSSHTFPEASAHLLAASPTPRWIEHLDHAGPILRDPLAPEAGTLRARPAPGLGLEWDERAVERWRAC